MKAIGILYNLHIAEARGGYEALIVAGGNFSLVDAAFSRFVQRLVESFRNETAVARQKRWLGNESFVEGVQNIGETARHAIDDFCH